MKRLVIGVLALLVLLVAVAVALPFLLPRDMIRAQVEQRVSAELGRDFRIEGPLTFRPWRPFALTLADVRLANPDWAETPDLARIDSVDLEVDALAYLGGAVVIERLIVERPALALELREDGTPSWQFDQTRGPADGAGNGAVGQPGDDIPEIRIGEIRIVDGSISLADHGTGETRSFTALELWARGDPGTPALNVDGSVVSAGERAMLNAVVGDLNGFLNGEPSSLTLDLAAPGLGVAANGEASPSGNTVLALTADMAPRVLLDWLGQPVDLPNGTMEAVTATVDMAAAPTGIALRALSLRVDNLTIQGDLELALAGRPTLTGTLDLHDLDLRPYLTKASPAAAGQPVTVAAAAPNAADDASSGGWPDQPLDLPLPLPIDLAVTVRQSSLITPDIALGIGAVSLHSDEAATILQIDELALYDGSMTGRIELRPGDGGDAEAAPLGLAVELDAIGVQLQPLLAALADMDRIAGNGNFRFAGTSSGASIAELIGGLDGEGAVLARDGALLGINIAATIRQVTSLGTLSAATEPQRTDFAEAGGTFTIGDGVLENADFALRAPVLRVSGAGTVDLGARTLDYRLMPRLAATLEGQDAAREDAFQAGLPLVVTGSWDDPAIRLDLGTALSGDVSDPASLANVVRNIASDPARRAALQDVLGIDPDSPLGTVFEGLGGLFGGPGEPAPEAGDEAEQAPPSAPDPAGQALDALRGLLRR